MALATHEVTSQLFSRQIIRFIAALLVIQLPPIGLLYFFSPLRSTDPRLFYLLCIVAVSTTLIVSCLYVLVQAIVMDRTVRPLVHLASVGELAARVAHDLRGPLTGIRVALPYFHGVAVSDAQYRERLDLLELAANRVERTADDLLRSHGGQAEVFQTVDIHRVLEEILGEYQRLPTMRDVAFERRYVEQAVFVHGQQDKLQRVCANLVKNALEAMELAGTLVVVTTCDEHTVRIAVQDTGCGMTPERVQQLTEGFVTTDKPGGHGIGLTFVHETIRAHQGALTITSSRGEGSCFAMTLPRAQPSVATFDVICPAGCPLLLITDQPATRERVQRSVMGQHGIVMAFESSTAYAGHRRHGTPAQTVLVDVMTEDPFDLIARLRLDGFQYCYLCSDAYWKPSVRHRAKDLQITLCPKPLPEIRLIHPMAMSTAIAATSSKTHVARQYATVLVIDDDEDILFSWELMCEELRITTLHTFANYEAFLASAVDAATIDVAFVDKNIPDSSWTSAAIINDLRERGVSNIVLASGENAVALRADPQYAQVSAFLSRKIPESFQEFIACARAQ